MARGFDRISNLPDPIVHHILSFLPTKDATRTAILSRRWVFLWSTFPILDFDESRFLRRGVGTCRRRFLDHMQQSLSRRNLTQIQKLRISTTSFNDSELNRLVSRYVASVFQGKLLELDLNIKGIPHSENEECAHYVLPDIIFSSASPLVTLSLEDCQFRSCNIIHFPSLKKLSLRYLHINDQMLLNIITGCPLVEAFKLESCQGFKTLRVFNPKLRYLVVTSCKDLSAFDMDVPNLESLRYNGVYHSFGIGDGAQHIVNLSEISEFRTSSSNGFCSLKSLVLSYARMKDEIIHHMLSSSPNLETMNLKNGVFGKMPFVLLEKLKCLEVQNCIFSELFEVNAPNLESLLCSGGFRHCKLKHCGGMGFGCIKTLSINGYLGLTDESLQDLLISCSLLEILCLCNCERLKLIKIDSVTLKSLVVDSCSFLKNGEIETPNLAHFKYVGRVVEFSRFITSCELHAELHLKKPGRLHRGDDFQPIKLRKLLRNFDKARILRLVSDCTEYVMVPKEEGTFPPLYSLRQLKVQTSLGDMNYIELLSGVLHISFCWESLFINLGANVIELKFQAIPNEEETGFLLTQWGIHDCIRDHLIEVRLENYDNNHKQMELVKFLLGTAVLLKSMFISLREKPPADAPRDHSEIINRIMNYPKASPTAEILFK